jgi:hypothetical protein
LKAPKDYFVISFRDGYAITDRYCVIYSKNIESEENIKTKVNWAVLNIETEKYTEKDKICHIPGTMDLKVEAIEDDILGVKVFIDKNGMKLNDIFLEAVNKKINLFFTEEETNSGGEEYSVVDVRHPDNVQRAKDEYHAKVALDRFSKGEDITLKEVIQAVEKSPNIMNKLKEVLLAKGNDDVADWITKDGKFKPNTPPDIKERFFLEAEEGNQLSTQLGSSIGGSIGSVIIGNNDFSNIEKIAISTSTTVVGQNVGEYLGGKSDAFDNIDKDLGNTLQGAVLSFAISSFFAKNDTLADILGMDGTFVGGLADFTVSYTLGYYGSQAISDLFAFSVNNISYSNNKIFKNLA